MEVAPLTGKYFYGYKFVFSIFPWLKGQCRGGLWTMNWIPTNFNPLQLPSSEIMLPMKRNDRLGVFSFRQTSFINLLSDNFLPRIAELALVYSMGRSMMLVSSQNRSWIEKDVFLIKLIKFVDNELKKIVKYRDGFQINIRWTDSRILQRFKTLFSQVCRLTDFLPCNRRHDVELSALAEKLPRQ